jgi:hypothetical protein
MIHLLFDAWPPPSALWGRLASTESPRLKTAINAQQQHIYINNKHTPSHTPSESPEKDSCHMQSCLEVGSAESLSEKGMVKRRFTPSTT